MEKDFAKDFEKDSESWVFWFSQVPPLTNEELEKVYQRSLVKVCEINSLGALQKILMHTIDAAYLRNKSGYHIFRKNYTPLWEENIDGGSLNVGFDLRTEDVNLIWQRFTQNCIQGKFSESVIGVSIKSRGTKKQICMWIQGFDENKEKVSKEIRELMADENLMIYASCNRKRLELKHS